MLALGADPEEADTLGACGRLPLVVAARLEDPAEAEATVLHTIQTPNPTSPSPNPRSPSPNLRSPSPNPISPSGQNSQAAAVWMEEGAS